MPCFWSAGYFSLGPMEFIEVSVSVPSAKLKAKSQELKVEGWNLDKIVMTL